MRELLYYGSVFSPLPGIYLALKYRKNLSKSMNCIFAIMVISFASDIFGVTLAKFKVNNLPIILLYELLEGLLFLLFFKYESAKHKKLVHTFIGIYVIAYLAEIILISGYANFNPYSSSLEALLMISLAVFYFYSIYESETVVYLDKSPTFWIAIGILVYFAGAFFSFLLSTDILSTSYQSFYGSWMLHNMSNILKNLLFFMGFLKVNAAKS